MHCWAPEINVYDWSRDGMFDALYCESKGDEDAVNGRYTDLFQSDDGPTDAVSAFEDAYYNKWIPAAKAGDGSSPWRATYGRYCAA